MRVKGGDAKLTTMTSTSPAIVPRIELLLFAKTLLPLRLVLPPLLPPPVVESALVGWFAGVSRLTWKVRRDRAGRDQRRSKNGYKDSTAQAQHVLKGVETRGTLRNVLKVNLFASFHRLKSTTCPIVDTVQNKKIK